MSNKERILQLIDNVSDNKLVYIVNILESLQAYANDEVIPDEWDKEMMLRAEQINDGETVNFDELLKKDGFTYAEL